MRAKLAGIFPSLLMCAWLHGALAVAAEPSTRPEVLAEQGAAGFGKFYGVPADEMAGRMRQLPWAYYGRMTTRTQEVVVASNERLPAPPDVYVTRFSNGETLEEFALDELHERHLSVAASGLEFYENLSTDKIPKPYSDESREVFSRWVYSVATPLAIIGHAFPQGPSDVRDGVTETTFPYHLTWGHYEEVMAKVVAKRINSHLIAFSIDVPSNGVAYSAELEWDSELGEALPDSMSLLDWRLKSGLSFATLGEARRAPPPASRKYADGKRRGSSKATPAEPPCLLIARRTPAPATGRGTAPSRGSRVAAR